MKKLNVQPNFGLMLVNRLQCWPNIKQTLAQHIVFSGVAFFPEVSLCPMNHWVMDCCDKGHLTILANVGTMLATHRGRCATIMPTLGERLVLSGNLP